MYFVAHVCLEKVVFWIGAKVMIGFPFYTQRCRGAWYGSDKEMGCVLFAIFFCIYYKESVDCFLNLTKDETGRSWIDTYLYETTARSSVCH